MEGLREALRRTGGIHAVAARLDQPFSEIAAVADAALPLLAAAFHAAGRRLGGGETGCRAILARLNGLGGGEMAASVMNPETGDATAGEAMLDFLLPQPGARSAVTHAAARQAGDPVWQAAAALPVLAMLTGGYVAARSLEFPNACRLDELLCVEGEDELAAAFAEAGLTA